jgi:hypothetical protein
MRRDWPDGAAFPDRDPKDVSIPVGQRVMVVGGECGVVEGQYYTVITCGCDCCWDFDEDRPYYEVVLDSGDWCEVRPDQLRPVE